MLSGAAMTAMREEFLKVAFALNDMGKKSQPLTVPMVTPNPSEQNLTAKPMPPAGPPANPLQQTGSGGGPRLATRLGVKAPTMGRVIKGINNSTGGPTSSPTPGARS